ncbi:hypothetical protein F2Q69_00059970 [Brassica cretica]|uniref:Uncharacterized protein n=1 Tax=Brassica cretica TaxID=69181 RepID=A0A8S9RE25_BRACR|nr:hypothetical protein F2Q69_00059970 [Brassica cretica]
MSETVRSLRSDRIVCCVATDSFAVTDRVAWSVATGSFAGRSLCSDRPIGLVGRYAATDSFADRFDESTETSARFHRKVLRKDFFTEITFRKSVHADFYGYLDVNFTVYIRDLFREFSAVCKLAGFLKSLEYWPREKFWNLVSGCLILCLEMLETSVLGLGQDLGLITALGGAMTTSTYVSRIVFDLIHPV